MLRTQLLARMDDHNKLLVKNFNFSTENKEPNEDKKPDRKKQTSKQLVKPMNSLPVNRSTESLIIGSSITKRIPNKSLPKDVEIHAFRDLLVVRNLNFYVIIVWKVLCNL